MTTNRSWFGHEQEQEQEQKDPSGSLRGLRAVELCDRFWSNDAPMRILCERVDLHERIIASLSTRYDLDSDTDRYETALLSEAVNLLHRSSWMLERLLRFGITVSRPEAEPWPVEMRSLYSEANKLLEEEKQFTEKAVCALEGERT